MKTFLAIMLAVAFVIPQRLPKGVAAPEINGSWKMDAGGAQMLMIIEDGYFAITSYDLQEKKFHATSRERMQVTDDSIVTEIEFNSRDTAKVGSVTSYKYKYEAADDQLILVEGGHQVIWTRGDQGSTPLTGCWRINGKLDENKMREMPLTPRKTLKILSGTNFQWFAINTQTKQFFGTGGGTYTLNDGKYTETIEFFSRDSSRVGSSLSFDAKVENGIWHHSGKSSAGNPVQETWVKYSGD